MITDTGMAAFTRNLNILLIYNMRAKKRYFTIKECLQSIADMENRALRIKSLLGYKSTDIENTQKSFMNISNSISIVLIQH